jgi:hypothetical protein
MSLQNSNFRRGDWVEVRTPEEIAMTLDERGTLDGVPFMPEMLAYCGRRFCVSRRVNKTCVDVVPWTIRELKVEDVILLEELRCSGDAHEGCQRACTIFWKEAWVRRVENGGGNASPVSLEQIDLLRPRLITKETNGRYFCQSTEMMKVTQPLSVGHKILKCFKDIWCGNYTFLQMLRLLALPMFVRAVRSLGGVKDPRGVLDRVPAETLSLKAGDMVEVKRPDEILQTLDRLGSNRGLRFGYPMLSYCGRRYRVRDRLDRMILETTGEMKSIKNTVTLEGVNCACKFVIGGCPRSGFDYWREAWLRKVEETQSKRPEPEAPTSASSTSGISAIA